MTSRAASRSFRNLQRLHGRSRARTQGSADPAIDAAPIQRTIGRASGLARKITSAPILIATRGADHSDLPVILAATGSWRCYKLSDRGSIDGPEKGAAFGRAERGPGMHRPSVRVRSASNALRARVLLSAYAATSLSAQQAAYACSPNNKPLEDVCALFDSRLGFSSPSCVLSSE